MAGGKEIRTKISCIKNTQKITRAMEMVAASKMRKTQNRMQATRPYAVKMAQIIGHLAHADPEYRHPYLQERTTRRVGVIIVSSDRGLCGGLNNNLFRKTITRFKQWEKDGIGIELCTVGSKASGFFSRLGANISGQAPKIGGTPHMEDLIGVVKVMLDAYVDGEMDELHVLYNAFINTMTQEPIVQQLIPVRQAEQIEEFPEHWDYIYEPDAKEVLDNLMTRYIESIVYQGLVENNACEQAARMVAMKSASDNAGKLIDELQLVYNKARQAAITQEISEIVAGAAAV